MAKSGDGGLAPGFSIVTAPVIARLLAENINGCVEVVKSVYLAHAHGATVNPPSLFLRPPGTPNSRIIALPAQISEPWQVSGIKWVASYPDNICNGLPRASAALILNNIENGYPVVCMEGSLISAARTAASAVIAADHLVRTPRRALVLSIVGTGFIARSVYQFLLGTGWAIDHVRAYDITRSEAERFVTNVCRAEQHASVDVAPDLASAIREADLILFTTVSPKPYLHDSRLLEYHPAILHLSLRDIAPEIILQSCNIADDIDHVMRADTSLCLAEKLAGSRDFVTGTLADLIEGKCTADMNRTRIFSPFGLGVLDVAVGKWLYDLAVERSLQIEIPDFYGDLSR